MGTDRSDARIRRVGFRFGTDQDLAAMHMVESEIEVERHPTSTAQPLPSYVGFARNLPSQFDDHTWLAEADDGTPIGCCACWSNSAGDPRVMECYVYVRPPWRRRGVGWRLASAIAEEAEQEGRFSLVWSTFDVVPAGEAFSLRVGGRVARVNRTSELRVVDVDWATVRSWIHQGQRRARGYRLDFWEGTFPTALLADAVTFHHIMQTAPREGLDVYEVNLAPADVVELDRALVEAGRERWTIFVRGPDDQCVGGTEMTFEPWQPAVALQQNTAIHPEHRGHGLAKWAKASMLQRIRDQRPEVVQVRTGNAFSNAPMLAINDALGFQVVETRTEWQAELVRPH